MSELHHANWDDEIERTAARIAKQDAPDASVKRVEQAALQLKATPTSTVRKKGRRFPLAITSLGAGVTAALVLLAVSLLTMRTSVGWEQVAKALQAKQWIHGTVEFDGKHSEMWLSHGRGVWAFRLTGSTVFVNEQEGVKYSYRDRGVPPLIEKLPIGGESAERVLPIEALAAGKPLGAWLMATEKIVGQTRREVSENGKRWIDFELKLHRGGTSVLRVDPATRLPVYLSSMTNGETYKWKFDYPETGPSDIFALGIDRDTRVVDRTLSKPADAVMAGMAKSRGLIDDFELTSSQVNHFSVQVVKRRGSRWRVDAYHVPTLWSGLKDGEDWLTRFHKLSGEAQLSPLFVCDGKSVYENTNRRPGEPKWQMSQRTAVGDLMNSAPHSHLSGTMNLLVWSKLYPELAPQRGWGFEVDMNPPSHPQWVLIKRSAEIASAPPATAHEWYYVDPKRGHAVVYAELFNLPKGVEADPDKAEALQRLEMSDFVKSERGWWYCRQLDSFMPAVDINGQALPPSPPKQTLYRFNFDVKFEGETFEVKVAE